MNKYGQLSFCDLETSNRKRTGKRAEFLKTMDDIIPWKAWVEMIEPYYPTGKRGRPVKDIETMLRMYMLQCWFNLSDEGVEDAIYDSLAMTSFMRINYLEEQVPDATTLLKFRHLLEKNKIGAAIFEDVKNRLEKAGLLMHGGTIVDATIIEAPSSTKNASYVSKMKKINGIKFEIKLWDTAGQEKFKSVTKSLFMQVQGFIAMFDLTKEESFITCIKMVIQSIALLENVPTP